MSLLRADHLSERTRGGGKPTPRPARPVAMWVLIGVPVLLLLVLAWQVGSTMLRSEAAVRSAASVARVSLEPDPAGARVEMVPVDRVGADTTVNGDITVRVREPDGAVWPGDSRCLGQRLQAAAAGPPDGGAPRLFNAGASR